MMNTKQLLTGLAATATLVLAAPSSQATLLFYEGFDYDAGDLDGNGGWNATSHMQVALNGTDTDDYTGTYSSVTTTGGYTFNTTGSGGFADVTLGSSVTSTFTDGSVTWLSFIDSRGTNGANAKGALAIGAAALTDPSGNITNPSMVGDGIGLAAHDNNMGEAAYWATSGVTVGGTDLPGSVGRDRFNIAKITWSAGSDTIEWAFFDSGATITEATFNTAGKSTVSASLDQSTFDTLSLGSNYMHFDEIRIGTTFTDAVSGTVVVPEPSSLALLGLGGLLVARRRRS